MPIASAGHNFHVSSIRGKFHGTMAPTTPEMKICALIEREKTERDKERKRQRERDKDKNGQRH